MHDEEKKHKVTLTLPSGTTLVLDDETQKVELRDKESKDALLMDLKEGNISLTAANKIELSAGGEATVTLEKAGNITIKASQKAAMEGVNVEEKASANLKLEGATAAVKSSGTLELTATGNTTLKGLMININ